MRNFRLLAEVGVYEGGLTRLNSRVEARRLLWAQYLSTPHQSRAHKPLEIFSDYRSRILNMFVYVFRLPAKDHPVPQKTSG